MLQVVTPTVRHITLRKTQITWKVTTFCDYITIHWDQNTSYRNHFTTIWNRFTTCWDLFKTSWNPTNSICDHYSLQHIGASFAFNTFGAYYNIQDPKLWPTIESYHSFNVYIKSSATLHIIRSTFGIFWAKRFGMYHFSQKTQNHPIPNTSRMYHRIFFDSDINIAKTKNEHPPAIPAIFNRL